MTDLQWRLYGTVSWATSIQSMSFLSKLSWQACVGTEVTTIPKELQSRSEETWADEEQLK